MKRFIIIALLMPLSIGTAANLEALQLAKPTPQQLAFMDMEIGVFIHYGLNVYTGQEHGDGFEPASKFNPTALDTDQWVRAAKSMGAKYAVLTARHEGGFCLWPTKTTDYSIANSPYMDGKGDIVRDFAASCRKYGLKVGVYHTASHDAHHTYKSEDRGKVPWGPMGDQVRQRNFEAVGAEGRQAYLDLQVAQIRELLTDYGDIAYIWCDHWNGGKTADDDGAWIITGNATWRAVTDEMRRLQPNCLMMGPDTWVPGNEGGYVVYPMWNAVNTTDGTVYGRPAETKADSSVPNNYGLMETGVSTGHPLGKFWRSRECTTNTGFHHGGWFWHPDDVRRTYARTLPEHINLYYRTIGLGASAIINLPPDQRGLVPDDIVASAKVFGDEIKQRFAHPIAELKGVTSGNTVELAWQTPTEINTIVTMENIANGQKIAKYTLEAFVDGQWKLLKPVNKLKGRKPYNSNPSYETIGQKKIDRIEPVTTNRIRFRCLESVVEPVELRSLMVFNCESIDKKEKE